MSSQTWENYLEVNEEDFKMCVLKREDLLWTDGLPNVDKDSATFTIGTFCINTYTVIIGPQCYCTCPSKVRTDSYFHSCCSGIDLLPPEIPPREPLRSHPL